MSTYIDRLRSQYQTLQDPSVTDEDILRILPRVRPQQFGGMDPDQVRAVALEDDWAITRGFKAGVDQLQALGGGLLGLAGDATGWDGLRDAGLDIYQRNMDEASINAPTTTFDDLVEDPDGASALEWAGYQLGNLAPTMLTSIAGGGIGGLVAKKGAQKVVGRLVADQLAKGATREAAQKVAGQALAKRLATGQTLGAMAASMGMQTGSIYGDTEDVDVSLLHGVISGSFDALPIGRALNKFGLASAAKDQVKKNVTREIFEQGLFEGSTEALQTLVEQHASHWVESNGESLLNNLGAINWSEIREAAAAGALGGTVMGGGVGLLNRKRPVDDANERIERAGEDIVARGGDALESELAKAEAAASELPKAATESAFTPEQFEPIPTAQQTPEGPFTPDQFAPIQTAEELGNVLPEARDWGDTRRPSVRSWAPEPDAIDDAIAHAEAAGTAESAIRLRNMRGLYQRAAALEEAGHVEAAGLMYARANAIHESVIGPPPVSAPVPDAPTIAGALPAPALEGAIEGGELVPAGPAADSGVTIEGRRAPPKVGAESRGLLGRPTMGAPQQRLTADGTIYGEAPAGQAVARETTRQAFEDEQPTGADWRPGVDRRTEAETLRRGQAADASLEPVPGKDQYPGILSSDPDPALLPTVRDQGLPDAFASPGVRAGIERLSQDLVKGGGITTLVEDGVVTGRTPSVNPGWYQRNADDLGSVGYVQATVKKALKGDKLGPKQQRVIEHLVEQAEVEQKGLESYEADATGMVYQDAYDQAVGTGVAQPAGSYSGISIPPAVRRAASFGAARAAALRIVGKDLVSVAAGMKAKLSRNSLDKMLSESAVSKSASAEAHKAAVANIDDLFARSVLGWSKPDSGGDPNIRAIHRMFAPLEVDGTAYLAKMTVKEMAQIKQGTKIYSVESVEISEKKNPAVIWVDAAIRADGLDPTSTPPAGSVMKMAQAVEDFNAGGVGQPRARYDDRTADMFADQPRGTTPAADRPPPRSESQGDMFGAQPEQQAMADEQRKRDARRSPGRDVPADVDGGLFSNQQQQTDLTDAPRFTSYRVAQPGPAYDVAMVGSYASIPLEGDVVAAAKMLYDQNLRGRTDVTRPELSGPVRFSGKGWTKFKNGLRADAEKAQLVQVLPDLIRGGDYGGREAVSRSDDIVAFHYIDGLIQLDSRVRHVGVTIGEDSDGNLFYNANFDPDALYAKRKAERLAGGIAPEARPSGAGRDSANMGRGLTSVESVEQAGQNVNGAPRPVDGGDVSMPRSRYDDRTAEGALDFEQEIASLENTDPYDGTRTRSDTTPEQTAAGRDAVGNLLRLLRRAYRLAGGADSVPSGEPGVRLLGLRIARRFSEGRSAQLVGETVSSPADLAALAQVYRDPRFETFRILLLDDNKRVIGERTITSRLPAAVRFGDDGAIVGQVREAMSASGASSYYVMHNHPSGRATPSGINSTRGDIPFTRHLASQVPGFERHVIIDRNEYAVIRADGSHEVIADESLNGVDFWADPAVPHDQLGIGIDTPRDAARVARAVADDSRAVLVSLAGGARGEVNAISSVPMSVLDAAIDADAATRDKLAKALLAMNRTSGSGGGLIVVLPRGQRNAIRYGALMDTVAMDVIDSMGNSIPARSRKMSFSGAPSTYMTDTDARATNVQSRGIRWEGADGRVEIHEIETQYGADPERDPIDLGKPNYDKPIKWEKDRVALRAKARFGEGKEVTVEAEDGSSVIVAWRGVKHATRKTNHDALLVVENIERVLRASREVRQSEDKLGRNNVVAVYEYEAPILIAGEAKTALLYVRESLDGRRFYDNAVVEERKSAGADAADLDGAAGLPASQRGASLELSPPLWADHQAEGISDDESGQDVSDATGQYATNQAVPPSEQDVGFDDHLSRWDKLKSLFVDRFHALDKVQKAQGDQSADPMTAITLFPGSTRARLDDLEKSRVEPLTEAIHDSGVSFAQVAEFLHARHAKEANRVLKERNPDRADNESLSGMSDADTDRILSRYRSHSRMQKIGEMVDDMTREHVQQMVADELITQAEGDRLLSMYQHYVPLHREDLKTGPGGRGRGFDIRGKETKLRAGSNRAVDYENMIARLVAQSQTSIVRGEKNRVAQRLYRLAESNPDESIWSVTDVPENPYLKADGTIGYRPNMMDASVMSVKFGGEQKYLWLDPESEHASKIASAMKNLDSGRQNGLTSALLTMNRYLSSINTSLSPEFVISNFFRDIQTAAYNLTDTDLATMEKDVVKRVPAALKAIHSVLRGKGDARYAAEFEAFRKAGGMTGWSQHYDDLTAQMKSIQRGLEWKTKPGLKQLRGALKAIEDYNQVVENGVRLATFITAREKGISTEKAARMAKEVTVDFNRRGEWGTAMNAMYLFYNASVQGSARLLRAALDPKNKRLHKILLGTVTFAAGLDLVNRMMAGADLDDDEDNPYDLLPGHVRDRNLVIWNPADSGPDYFKIPLPWGYNTFFIMGQELGAAVSAGVGDNPGYSPTAGMARIAGGILNSFNPVQDGSILQTLSPTVADPLVRIGENKDWHGGRLYPDYNQAAPNYTKTFSNVRPTSKAIAEWMGELTKDPGTLKSSVDVSPEWLDMMLDFTTGSVGRLVADSGEFARSLFSDTEREWNDIPIARKVIGEIGESGQKGAFYDKFYEIEDIRSELSRTRREDPGDYAERLAGIGRRRLLLEYTKQTKSRMNALKKAMREAQRRGNDEVADRYETRLLALMDQYSRRFNRVMYP